MVEAVVMQAMAMHEDIIIKITIARMAWLKVIVNRIVIAVSIKIGFIYQVEGIDVGIIVKILAAVAILEDSTSAMIQAFTSSDLSLMATNLA